jgi:hypothetical protein
LFPIPELAAGVGVGAEAIDFYLLPHIVFEEKFVAEQLSPTCPKMKEKFLAFFRAFPWG